MATGRGNGLGNGRGDGRDEIDARFADIVARWDDPPTEALDTEQTTPAAEPTTERPPAATEPSPANPEPFPEPVPWRQHVPPPDDEEERFVPPPPRPLPAFLADWSFYVALVGLVGGPLWLVYLVVFEPTERSVMWAAGALTMAGFVTLVMRSPHERDPDDHDDGAQV